MCLQNEEKRNLNLGGHVGFDSLPDQLVSKSVTQGFCFNILCVGKHLPFSSKPLVCVRVPGMGEEVKLQAVNVIVLLRSSLCSLLSLSLSLFRGDGYWEVDVNEHTF